MALFETLKHMAENNMDIVRYDTVHSAEVFNKGKDGKIAMCTTAQSVLNLGGVIGKQTHIPILFMVDAKQYEEVEKLLKERF